MLHSLVIGLSPGGFVTKKIPTPKTAAYWESLTTLHELLPQRHCEHPSSVLAYEMMEDCRGAFEGRRRLIHERPELHFFHRSNSSSGNGISAIGLRVSCSLGHVSRDKNVAVKGHL